MLTWGHRRRAPSCQSRPTATAATRFRRKLAAVSTIILPALLLAECQRRDPIANINSLDSQGKPEQALQLAETILAQARTGNREYWQLVLRRVQILEELNRRDGALAWLNQLPIRTAPSDSAVLLLREQALIETETERLEEADRHLNEALSIAGDSGQVRMLANLQVRRAMVFLELNQSEEAERSLNEAERLMRQAGDRSLEPYILSYRGETLAARNRFEEALTPLDQALKGLRTAGQNAAAARVIVSQAWCYYRLGQMERALDSYQGGLKLAAPADRHLFLGHLGNIYFEEHDFARAAENYERAAAGAKGRDQSYYLRWLHNLAQALIEQGKWEEAERFNNEALEDEKKTSGSAQPLTLVNLGRIEAHRRQYQAAERDLVEVTVRAGVDVQFSLEAFANLAELHAAWKAGEVRRDFQNALALADETSAKLREDENKLSYLSSLIDVHRRYVDFLMKRGDGREAFAMAESSRARLLRERLDLPASPAGRDRVGKLQAAARASGTTFLAYWVGWKKSYVWVIGGSRFDCFPLPGEAEIRGLVEEYQKAVERPGPPSAEALAAGHKLYDLLLARHPGVLRRGGRYVIVPDGPLYALNFETLPVAGKELRYWIEDAAVALAPSLDLLLTRPAPAVSGRAVLLVGDAEEWSREYPKLLHAREEIEGIRRQFPGMPPTLLLGGGATPVAYRHARPTDYAYIHFAAHATANKYAPFDSAIILSGGNTSGRLSVKEVLATPVHADLVTISACHSAGARTYWGEGLVGFAWAFLQSGARGVVAGLWDVSDYSSPPLMQDLYAGLAASKSSAEALRAAKLKLIAGRKYAEPYYWGAFQLYEGVLPQADGGPNLSAISRR
jgi:CHAT domain-containing protein